MTHLERALPLWHFSVQHSGWVAAAPHTVWQALRTLSVQDLILTRPLVALRHLRSSRSFARGTLFDDGPVTMLHIDAPCYAVGGAIAKPWHFRPARQEPVSLEHFTAFAEPGWVKYLTDFSVDPAGGGTRITTVTRGVATDERARRLFNLYWTLIRPGVGVVRRDLLASTARRVRQCENPGSSDRLR